MKALEAKFMMGEGRNASYLFIGTAECLLPCTGVYPYTDIKELSTMNYTLKMVKVVNFMIFIFYHNRENKICRLSFANNGKVL